MRSRLPNLSFVCGVFQSNKNNKQMTGMNRSTIHVALLAGLLALAAVSCNQSFLCERGSGPVVEEILSLPDFDAVEVLGSAEVFLSKGDSISVRVRSQENVLESLDFRVVNDQLIVDVEGCFFDYGLEVFITLDRPLRALSLSGSGSIASEDTLLAASLLELRVTGSGSLDLPVDAGEINTRISGSGDVFLQGKASRHEFQTSGSGSLNAFGLLATDYEVQVSGSSKSEVYVNGGTLDVEITGSGEVAYKGAPSGINTRISGSGRVVDAN